MVRVLSGALLLAALPARTVLAQEAVQPTPTPALALLPGGILPDSPLAQVVKLVQAGVDVSIIQSFITNSTSTFNLDANKIIALKDVGAPNDLTALMMQHDRELQAQIAAATPPPVAVPTPPPLGTAAPGDAAQLDNAPAAAAPTVTVNYFYNLLSPYGNWVAIDGFGRCWQPGVAVYQPDWQPYGDHGHWVYTDSGWYWVSDYSWGWAPFHYGRWVHDPQLGWCWCPDTVWGPAWVIWRWSDDYCGWAPLPPGAEYVDGSGLVYDGNAVAPDFDFGLAPETFLFVTLPDFCDPHPARHRIARGRVANFYHQTIAYNHIDRDERRGFINHGIDPARISRVTHLAIRPLDIHETSGAAGLFGQGDAVQGYSMVVNRARLRDHQDNLAVAWNRNEPNAGSTPAPAGGHEPERERLNYQRPTEEPMRGSGPGQGQRMAGPGGYIPPPAAHYETIYAAPVRPEPPRGLLPPPPEVRPEPPRGLLPPPETRSEPPRGLQPPPEVRPEPPRFERPPPREEPKPAAEPSRNNPPPAEAKSDKDSGKKGGGH